MIRTKYVVILAVALLVAMTISWVVLLTKPHSEESMVQAPPIVPTTPPQEYTITVGETKRDGSIRESLRAKLETEPADELLVDVVVSEDEALPAENRVDGLLVGDGRWSAVPEQGYIYHCQGGVVAPVSSNPSWVSGDRWFPEDKVSISGAQYWTNDVTIGVAEGVRVVRANTLPDHGTAEDGLVPRMLTMQLPLQPQVVGTTCVSGDIVGVARNGVPIYQALNSSGHDTVARISTDSCGGYIDSNGQYHYRNQSECLLASVYEGAVSTLVGYALDGFGIYASVEGGKEITNEDLDKCHGHTHEIPWDGEMRVMYHYHMTDEFPYTVGCFKGVPRTPHIRPFVASEPNAVRAATTTANTLETNQ